MATVDDIPSSLGEQERSAPPATAVVVNRDPDQTAILGMPPAKAFPDLPEAVWRLLEDQVEAFESAWTAGEQPRIDDYLLPDDPTGGQLLIELVHADLELRMRFGTHAEDYLRHFPELADRADVVAALREAEQHFLKETARHFPRNDSTTPSFNGDKTKFLPEVTGYKILGEAGRGGMGIVYAATDLSLNRTVAIKTLLPGAAGEERIRLQREAAAAAGIQHPHVAQVFQTVEQDDRLYVISEYLPGGTLDERMRGDPWPIADAATLIESLARAVAEGHELGIVHRDLKPANILFTADDVPKIADFGLVKRLDDASDSTRTGIIAGSPSYMAPEQSLGGHGVGMGVDVWALGAILYELLTGRPPFRDASVLGTLELIRTSDPVAPRRLVHQLPPDLETICLHCLQKEPAKRYASAAELADDLGRFLRGEPVKARPIGWLERGWRWGKKNRAISILAVLLAISLAVGTGASLIFGIKAVSEAELAHISEQRERTARQLAERILYTVELRNAHSAIAAGDPALAADWIAKHRGTGHAGDRFVVNYLDRLVRAPGRTIDHLDDAAYCIQLSPDKRWLAACGASGTIHLYHAGTWKPAGQIVANQGELNGLSFSQDGERIASAGDDGTAVVWDVETGKEIWQTQVFKKGVLAFGIEHVLDDRQIAVGGHDGTIMLLDAETGTPTGELRGHTNSVQAIAVTPDGRTLISVGDDRRTINWDLVARKKRWCYEADKSVDRSHTFDLTRDGRQIVLGSFNSVVTFLETTSGEVLFEGGVSTTRLASDTGLGIRAIALVGPGDDPAIMFDGGTVIETKLGKEGLVPMPERSRSVWRVPRSRVRSMIEYEGGASLITASDEGFIDIWHREEAHAWKNIEIEGAHTCAWIQRADGRNLLVVAANGEDRGCWLADPLTGSRSRLDHTPYHCVRATPDGGLVVLGSESDGTITAFDLSSKQPRRRWTVSARDLVSAMFGPAFRIDDFILGISPLPEDGQGIHFRVRALDKSEPPSEVARVALFRLDRGTGEVVARRELEHTTATPAVSPDGRTLVVGTSYVAELYMMASSNLSIRRTLSGHAKRTTAFCFSPEGRWLATTGEDLKIHLWRGDQRVHTWRTEAERISDMEFSPDGTLLVTSSDHHPPSIWDVETQQLLLEPGRYPSPARTKDIWTPARFSIDGQWLAIARGSTVTFFDGRPYPNTVAPRDAAE